MLSVSSFLAAFMMNSGESASWNYEDRGNNVSHWGEYYAECGYSRQSPIDVPMQFVSSCKEPLELEWTSGYSHYAIMNGAHSLKAVPFEIDHNGGGDIGGLEVLHHTNDTAIRLTNKFYNHYESAVNKEYCFDSLHFHWGRTENEGSEHTINGKAYPLEVHLVHYSCDYYMAGEALKEYASGEADKKYDDENVLAVIGVMFEIGEANPVLAKMLNEIIIDGIYENKAVDNNYLEMYYTEFDVADLLPANREMVAYLGSLTTPPCYETVRWHVLKEPMTVSEEQMVQFRRLLEGTVDADQKQAPNFRPPQPRNGRTIWSCQEDVDEDNLIEGKDGGSVSVVIKETDESEEWKNIAVAAIILFAATTLICLFVLCYLCKAHKRMKEMSDSHHAEPVPVQSRTQLSGVNDQEQEPSVSIA